MMCVTGLKICRSRRSPPLPRRPPDASSSSARSCPAGTGFSVSTFRTTASIGCCGSASSAFRLSAIASFMTSRFFCRTAAVAGSVVDACSIDVLEVLFGQRQLRRDVNSLDGSAGGRVALCGRRRAGGRRRGGRRGSRWRRRRLTLQQVQRRPDDQHQRRRQRQDGDAVRGARSPGPVPLARPSARRRPAICCQTRSGGVSGSSDRRPSRSPAGPPRARGTRRSSRDGARARRGGSVPACRRPAPESR